MSRPRLTREVLDLHEALLLPPELVALDTSFVVEALVESKPGHALCRSFLERLAETGAVVVISPLLQLELAETAIKLAVKERHPKGEWRDHRRDGRVRRRAGKIMDDTMESWRQHLEGLTSVTETIDEIADQATSIMRGWGLASYDAAHAATAWHLEVYEFVTLDTDFAQLPQKYARIYTTPSRLRAARRRRGGS